MKEQSSAEKFESVIGHQAPAIRDMARATRQKIYDLLPQVVEIVWERQGIAGYGTGPKKMSEHFSWIQPAKQHVTLGFMYGAELPDPGDLLEGTGKLLRHVKLYSLEDLEQQALTDMLTFAITWRVPPPKSMDETEG